MLLSTLIKLLLINLSAQCLLIYSALYNPLSFVNASRDYSSYTFSPRLLSWRIYIKNHFNNTGIMSNSKSAFLRSTQRHEKESLSQSQPQSSWNDLLTENISNCAFLTWRLYASMNGNTALLLPKSHKLLETWRLLKPNPDFRQCNSPTWTKKSCHENARLWAALTMRILTNNSRHSDDPQSYLVYRISPLSSKSTIGSCEGRKMNFVDIGIGKWCSKQYSMWMNTFLEAIFFHYLLILCRCRLNTSSRRSISWPY